VSDTPGSRWPFSVSVVIPALNEGATIGAVIAQTRAACPDAEVLVVGQENWFGSRCRKSSITRRRIARNPDVRSRIGMPTR
jgi:hypothetical protein